MKYILIIAVILTAILGYRIGSSIQAPEKRPCSSFIDDRCINYTPIMCREAK
jgi:hypothetical protein